MARGNSLARATTQLLRAHTRGEGEVEEDREGGGSKLTRMTGTFTYAAAIERPKIIGGIIIIIFGLLLSRM